MPFFEPSFWTTPAKAPFSSFGSSILVQESGSRTNRSTVGLSFTKYLKDELRVTTARFENNYYILK